MYSRLCQSNVPPSPEPVLGHVDGHFPFALSQPSFLVFIKADSVELYMVQGHEGCHLRR